MTPLSHSTRRTLARGVSNRPHVARVPDPRHGAPFHESDAMPYVPVLLRMYSDDYDAALPVARRVEGE